MSDRGARNIAKGDNVTSLTQLRARLAHRNLRFHTTKCASATAECFCINRATVDMKSDRTANNIPNR